MDAISKQRRSKNMSAIRSKNTGPEVAVRRIVSRLGYRCRMHGELLPGKPDFVFQGLKKAIFVHGCFWHQHSKAACSDGRMPKSNTSYWNPKLEANVSRDKRNRARLRRLGWQSIVIWECQIEATERVAKKIATFLQGE